MPHSSISRLLVFLRAFNRTELYSVEPSVQFRRSANPSNSVVTAPLRHFTCFAYLVLFVGHLHGDDSPIAPLAGTKPLAMEGDIAQQLVEGVDRFLLSEIEKSVERRKTHWQPDFSSPQGYNNSIRPNRARLAHILGVRDKRKPFDALELVATTNQPALVGRGKGYKIFAVRWPVIGSIYGEGLLLTPDRDETVEAQRELPIANVVAIADADQLPEMIAGLVDGVPAESQIACRLAEQGCRVVVPVLISREMQQRAPPGQRGRANLTNREYLYRSAFELGRHLIGYEIQKVLAVVDWFQRDAQEDDAKIGVIGYGEGGMLALYAAALDTRIDAACVSGHFGSRESIWQQPLDRNVFGLLEQFGDAEVAAMIAPRALVVEACAGPEVELPSEGGAPATLGSPTRRDVRSEFLRLEGSVRRASFDTSFELVESGGDGQGPFGSPRTLTGLLSALSPKSKLIAGNELPSLLDSSFDPRPRQQRQIQQIDDFNQWLLRESPYVRRGWMNIGLERDNQRDESNVLDTSSPPAYEASVERFREYFRQEVIGHFDYALLPFNARTRKTYEHDKWIGYEVVLDVLPDVLAYGILLLPKDLKPDERRPVVVCQHGLEGRPQDVVSGDHRAYHDYAARLAERGFITFAPQNLYIGGDDFRTLQRKANTIKKSLFSIINPQHKQIINWLKTLPNVDGQRIAFYGLSYGGKSAMRIPALVRDYCLSICSADFNDWVWKNASSRAPYSYVWTKEYEIFEFDLGSTFNYAEMAALIAPRPFMVERGHFDGVAPDEAVAYEFAKVRHLYAARLGLPQRCEIEFFVGPHTINGQGTFRFLHKHLDWP